MHKSLGVLFKQKLVINRREYIIELNILLGFYYVNTKKNVDHLFKEVHFEISHIKKIMTSILIDKMFKKNIFIIHHLHLLQMFNVNVIIYLMSKIAVLQFMAYII